MTTNKRIGRASNRPSQSDKDSIMVAAKKKVAVKAKAKKPAAKKTTARKK